MQLTYFPGFHQLLKNKNITEKFSQIESTLY